MSFKQVNQKKKKWEIMRSESSEFVKTQTRRSNEKRKEERKEVREKERK